MLIRPRLGRMRLPLRMRPQHEHGDDARADCREDATDETGLPMTTFPEASPWPAERGLQEDFWPEA